MDKLELAGELVKDVQMIYSLSCTEFESNVRNIFGQYDIPRLDDETFEMLLSRILQERTDKID